MSISNRLLLIDIHFFYQLFHELFYLTFKIVFLLRHLVITAETFPIYLAISLPLKVLNYAHSALSCPELFEKISVSLPDRVCHCTTVKAVGLVEVEKLLCLDANITIA